MMQNNPNEEQLLDTYTNFALASNILRDAVDSLVTDYNLKFRFNHKQNLNRFVDSLDYTLKKDADAIYEQITAPVYDSTLQAWNQMFKIALRMPPEKVQTAAIVLTKTFNETDLVLEKLGIQLFGLEEESLVKTHDELTKKINQVKDLQKLERILDFVENLD